MLKKHAEVNAMPYFKFVDQLISKSSPILFRKTTPQTHPQEES